MVVLSFCCSVGLFFFLLLGVEGISCGLLFCLFLFRKPPVCLFEFSLLNEKTLVEQSSE